MLVNYTLFLYFYIFHVGCVETYVIKNFLYKNNFIAFKHFSLSINKFVRSSKLCIRILGPWFPQILQVLNFLIL